jgi:hypothetical protein
MHVDFYIDHSNGRFGAGTHACTNLKFELIKLGIKPSFIFRFNSARSLEFIARVDAPSRSHEVHVIIMHVHRSGAIHCPSHQPLMVHPPISLRCALVLTPSIASVSGTRMRLIIVVIIMVTTMSVIDIIINSDIITFHLDAPMRCSRRRDVRCATTEHG